MFQERILAKDIQHGLKKFTLRQERAFPFDVVDGKKYPYFVKDGKKYYFKHPSRPEFDLQDEIVEIIYQGDLGKFNQLKSAIFMEAKKLAAEEKKDKEAK